MNETKVNVTEKVIGDTLYIIESTVSGSARETVYEKVKRMILSASERSESLLAS